jgi:hypothetical protein
MNGDAPPHFHTSSWHMEVWWCKRLFLALIYVILVVCVPAWCRPHLVPEKRQMFLFYFCPVFTTAIIFILTHVYMGHVSLGMFSMTCLKTALQMNSVFNSAHFSQALKDFLSHSTAYFPSHGPVMTRGGLRWLIRLRQPTPIFLPWRYD